MKKILKFGAFGVLLILVLTFVLGGQIISKSVKAGVNAVAPSVLGVPVSVEDVSISLFNGSGTVTGLYVGNPEGYKTEKLLSVGTVHLDLSVTSLLSGLVHVESINVESPEIVYEKTLSGSNVADLLKKLESSDSKQTEESKPKSESKPIKIQIDHFSVEGGKIHLSAMGMTAPLPMPPLKLQDIGSNGGVTPKEAIVEVLSSVLSSITSFVLKNGDQLLGVGKDAFKAGEGLIKGGADSSKELIQGVKGLFGK